MRDTGGQRDDERRALLQAAVDTHGPAVHRDEFSDERQTDSRALVGARAGALDTVEAVEDSRQVVRRNADARVGDRELDRRAAPG